MPTVNDAARITTRDGSVWRTCAGCGLLAPLPPDVDTCPGCRRPIRHDVTGWDTVHRYANVLGRVKAWAESIPHVPDAERLDHIRQELAKLDNPSERRP
jgi:hypothetical protein